MNQHQKIFLVPVTRQKNKIRTLVSLASDADKRFGGLYKRPQYCDYVYIIIYYYMAQLSLENNCNYVVLMLLISRLDAAPNAHNYNDVVTISELVVIICKYLVIY